jgi:exopolysaccharide biosynthesis polyprenyl glycosylphosphotransferase
MIGESSSARAVAQKLAGAGVNAKIVAALEVDAQGRLLQAADLEEAFCELVRRHDVHRVIIAPAAGGSEAPLSLIRTAKHAGVRISVVPRMMEVVGSSVEFDYLDGLTMLGVRRFGLTLSSRLVKRAFDLAGSTLLLLAVAPLGLMAALAIRLDSRGPALFRQTRVGKDGQRFRMFKFRSMVDGAEEFKDALRHLNNVQGLFKLEDDPRVTRVGRVLRRVSLDELPQLLNVWRGEMSLVGPRPLVLDEDARVQGLDRYRLHLKPGMTGHWQILGATRVPLHEMVGIDYLYVANWSLWTDVKILLRTVPHVLASRGL